MVRELYANPERELVRLHANGLVVKIAARQPDTSSQPLAAQLEDWLGPLTPMEDGTIMTTPARQAT